MRCACIDIGSNTTRLLVADVAEDGTLTELLTQRAYTRLGRAVRADGQLGPATVAELVEEVAVQVRLARELAVERLQAVATAAVREAADARRVVRGIRERTGVRLRVLAPDEEARLAFTGACRTLAVPCPGELGVVDVGGGSSEIAVGTARDGARFALSLKLGSGALADAYLRSDPPAARELGAVRAHVAGAFDGLDVPCPTDAVAVGGSASSLRRLVGGVLEPETLERGLRVLAGTPARDVARRFELDLERVRLLPAGMLILAEAAERLGRPLQIGRGGLREGVVLAEAEAARAGSALRSVS